MEKVATGAWRAGPIAVTSGRDAARVVHFVGPSASRVPGEMQLFLDWFDAPTDRDALLVKAALAHLRFITIHPFDDGNGRITRALSDMLVARADNSAHKLYSISSKIERDKSAYYAALASAQCGTVDETDWVIWFLYCFNQALDDSLERLARAVQKAALWQAWQQFPLNARQIKMVTRLIDEPLNGHLTAERCSRMTKVSAATASSDLSALVAFGILDEIGGGRNAHYRLKKTP